MIEKRKMPDDDVINSVIKSGIIDIIPSIKQNIETITKIVRKILLFSIKSICFSFNNNNPI